MFRTPFVLALASLVAAVSASVATAKDDSADDGRRYALLVGVTDYKGTDLSNLKYAENDVDGLAGVLKGAGYKRVVLMTQAEVFKSRSLELMPTAANIRAQLSGVLEDRRSGDTVLLAFAGHGVTLRNPKGFYFCPQGANLSDPKTLVSLTEVYDTLSKSRAEVKLLLVDACRNDPLAGRSGGDGRLESVSRPVLPRPPGGVAALFSCSEGQKAYESEKFKHGVFFHHLIDGLKGKAANRQGLVTLDSLSDYVSGEVPDAVKQQEGPTVRQVPHKLGDVSGRVTLVSRGAAAAEPAGGTASAVVTPSPSPPPVAAQGPPRGKTQGPRGNMQGPPRRSPPQVPQQSPPAAKPSDHDRYSCAVPRTNNIARLTNADGKHLVEVLDKATMQVIWKADVRARPLEHVAASADGKRLYVAATIALVCYDAQTGKELWRQPGEGVCAVAAAADGSKVFFNGNGLQAADGATGKYIWKTLGGRWGAVEPGCLALTRDGKAVLVAIPGGTLVCISASDGALLWQQPRPAPGLIGGLRARTDSDLFDLRTKSNRHYTLRATAAKFEGLDAAE